MPLTPTRTPDPNYDDWIHISEFIAVLNEIALKHGDLPINIQGGRGPLIEAKTHTNSVGVTFLDLY